MPQEQHRQLGPISGPQVPESSPRHAAAQVLVYHPPINISWAAAGHLLTAERLCSLWGRDSSPAIKIVLGNVAPAVWGVGNPGCHQGSAQAWIPQDQFSLRLGPLWEGLTLKRWLIPVGQTCVRLHTATVMAAIPPVPAPMTLNSVLPCMFSGLPSCLPPLHQRSGECL